MPPLKGLDEDISGEALAAFTNLGHGDQIVIVDPSYSIPEGQQQVDYYGKNSMNALKGILDLVPIDIAKNGDLDVWYMKADNGEATEAERDFLALAPSLRLNLIPQYRLNESGFYLSTERHDKKTLYVKTRDPRAFACARFIVGHSQE